MSQKWLKKQLDPTTATGLWGCLLNYLVALRADIYRSQSTKPNQIKEESFVIPFGPRDKPAGEENSRREDHLHDSPVLPDEGGRESLPPEEEPIRPLTKEDIARVHKHERWVRIYGVKKAAEMVRAERAEMKKVREAQQAAESRVMR